MRLELIVQLEPGEKRERESVINQCLVNNRDVSRLEDEYSVEVGR